MLIDDIAALPGSFEKIERLVVAVRNKEPGTNTALICLWDTQPREIWEQANRAGLITGHERVVCLTVINRWERQKEEVLASL